MGWLLHTLGLDHKPRVHVDPEKEEAIRAREAQLAGAIESHKRTVKDFHTDLGKLVLSEVTKGRN